MPERIDERALLIQRLEQMTHRLPIQAVREALASDDVGAALKVAEHAAQGRTLTALERARAKGSLIKAQLLSQWPTVTVETAAALKNVSKKAIRARLRRGTLIGLDTADGKVLPAFQFVDDTGDRELTGLSEVLGRMSIRSDWMRFQWLVTPNEALGQETPVELLTEGPDGVDRVLVAASGLGVAGVS